MRRTGKRPLAGPVQMISVNGALSPARQSTVVMATPISLHLALLDIRNASDRTHAASWLSRPAVALRMDAESGLAFIAASFAASCCQSPWVIRRREAVSA